MLKKIANCYAGLLLTCMAFYMLFCIRMFAEAYTFGFEILMDWAGSFTLFSGVMFVMFGIGKLLDTMVSVEKAGDLAREEQSQKNRIGELYGRR